MVGVLGEERTESMRTITYTYDENKPTNRDYLIAALSDSIDDGGASYESVAEYNIYCPYIGYGDCLNEHEDPSRGCNSREYKEACVRCKLSWLAREYDTYPSDDGRWEIDDD